MTKIDIFSGFLGAGKTTLIKKLIAEAYADEKLVLIENEFGEIGIDGSFLQDAGVNITEMNSGCICCSLVGDFGKALKQVLNDYSPDRIIIEPSGVGKLSDVIRAVQNIDSEEILLNAFTTVVDVNKCKMYMKNFGEFFNNQIECANTIILSHTTGTSDEKLENCVQLLREHNAEADIITTPWEQLDGSQILDTIENRNTLDEELKKLENEEICPVCGGHHGDHHHDDDDEHECCHHHDHEHDHHHHHADEVFSSFGVETARKYTMDEIRACLIALDDEEKFGIVLRAKGIVNSSEGFIHFDYVPGEPDVRLGSAIPTGRLCVIGSKINEEAVKKLFKL